VAAVAALAAVDALFPEHRRSLIVALDAAHVHGLSKALVFPLAAALAVAARSLGRGSRRAWQIACVLLVLLLALHVERRFDDGAVVTGLMLVALVARRADFRLRGDPNSRPRLLLHAAVAATGVVAYGLVTLWANRLMADQPYTVPFALRVTGRALAGMSFTGADHLSGPVADWFPVSVFLLGTGALVFLLVEWLAPWRYRLLQEAPERELAQSLVASWGADTLAPFALRDDKSYFFSDDRAAFIAYRVVGGVAIVAGDPIGAPEAREELIARFIEFAHARGWRVAVLGASSGCLALYRGIGLRALYHGDEAVVETASFSLEGRPIRKVRQSVHRLQRAGFEARVFRPREVDAPLRAELERIAREWRGAAPERGFVMAFDALCRADDEEEVLLVGFDGAGKPHGFLQFGVSRAGSALSLSSMPRLRDVPNGFNEWLICESIAWARDHGFARVSLNFSPFAALLAPDRELTVLQRLQAAALRALKGWFQLDSLLVFNRKFFPEWEPRFVVYERRLDLPRVGLAALAAEAYLPFQ
jgi:lysyl-tRNA synthetase class 2